MSESILIIDDEVLVRNALRDVLQDEGYAVTACASFQEANKVFSDQAPDLALLDVWLESGEDGLALLPKLLSLPSRPSVMMISGHASIDQAVKCTKMGAYDFLEKPISIDRLLLATTHALQARKLQKENDRLRGSQLQAVLIGKSPSILQLHQLVYSIAKRQSSVLICGENGVGKEVVARMLHAHSTRSEGPFIAVNCAAIPETLIESELFGFEKGAFTGAHQAKMGRVEAAHDGTLLLDEVGDLSLSAQAKLLRVIQERSIARLASVKETSVNVRWLAATNKNLGQMVKDGTFREDLLFRLNVIRIDVPPLRERKEDIPLLAQKFLEEICSESGIPMKWLMPEAMTKLQSYGWPGNVRELKNVIERALVMEPTDEIGNAGIQFEVLDQEPVLLSAASDLLRIQSFKEARTEFERLFLRSRLQNNGFNVSRLAHEVGLERTYLYRKLKQFRLDSDPQ